MSKGKLYDFKVISNKYINSWEADLLHEIKSKRNSLAHWKDSFNNLWQNISYNDLLKYKRNIEQFLNWYIKIIEKYILDKPYLKVI